MQLKSFKSLCAVVLSAAMLGMLTPAVSVATHALDISIVKAPIVPDGTTAGAQTDFVLTFVDRDPSVPGIAMQTGGSVEVVFPDAFIPAPGGNLILLQGWPQSPQAPFPWTPAFNGNTVTVTMTGPFDDTTQFGPGPKQVHALLPNFQNPGPGRYPVSLTIDPDGMGTDVHSGIGWVQIIPKSRPSVNVVSIFSGAPATPPPFFNPFYQELGAGEATSDIGLYLWNRDSVPAVGVDLTMSNPNHWRLVQGKRTVGHVKIQAPSGASDYGLTSNGPSIEVDAFPPSLFVNTGQLIVQIHTDPDVVGEYVIDISMNGGNTERLFVTTTP